MDDTTLERYADYLDDLEKNNPQAYQEFLATVQRKMEAESSSNSSIPLMNPKDVIKQHEDPHLNFQPRFPGDKIMGNNGLAQHKEGIYIKVEPGFVMKTKDIKAGKKIFVNFCQSKEIQTFGKRKQLDKDGMEQEGMHVPLSLGPPHEVKDKKGDISIAFDVAVNPQVIKEAQSDLTGTFRTFLCELAIEYIDQKHKIQLDPQFKLPRLVYRGELPPADHYIRKPQAVKIQEVTTHKVPPPKVKSVGKHMIQYNIYEVDEKTYSQGMPSQTKKKCGRISVLDPAASTLCALTPEILAKAPYALEIMFSFAKDSPIRSSQNFSLELQAEYLTLHADEHFDISLYLPYPVVPGISSSMDPTHVLLSHRLNQLTILVMVDKYWDITTALPDPGSTQWLLMDALEDKSSSLHPNTNMSVHQSSIEKSQERPMTLVEKFHLLDQADQPNQPAVELPSHVSRKWENQDDEIELPEDRFHAKDMMSMHILQQRKAEKQAKAQQAEKERASRKKDIEDKKQRAVTAGKSWKEMYPSEPEVEYVDLEDFAKQQTLKFQEDEKRRDMDGNEEEYSYLTTEDAIRAAKQWSEQTDTMTLQSALAFDLL